MNKIEVKEINRYRFGVCGKMIFDTVPESYAQAWLETCPEAECLILAKADPFPETVRFFRKKRPEAKIIAPYYSAYLLTNILGEDLKIDVVRSDKKYGNLGLGTVSRAGKGSFLNITEADELIWSGNPLQKSVEAVVYEKPTVAIAYLSGCDFTKNMAEKIAEGIKDTEGVDVNMLDIRTCSTDDALAAFVNASGILIGTPSEDGDAPEAVWNLLTAMKGSVFEEKTAGVFGAATWDKDGAGNVTERLRQLKMNVTGDAFVVQYVPDETAINSIYEYGYDFGCRVKNVPNTHRSKLVKCLVCGEIFDASLGVCPVCGVGMDKCIPVEEEVINHKEDTDRTYLCIGGGIASLSAAEAIRRRDKTGRIVIVSSESNPPINRPMLTKNMVVAARTEGALAVKEEDWYKENNIELLINCRVVSINPELHAADLSDGTQIKYDRLIYAAGAECFVPPIPGADLPGVFTIRHLNDVKEIWKKIPDARKAVVIGAGVLGLEAAAELKRMRLGVNVLETAPRPMMRQIDDSTADALIKAAGEYGIPIMCGVNTSRISGEGSARGVILDDGTEIPADIVVISCGVRANLTAALNADVKCGRAVIVDKYMQTSKQDIYAAGDCAEFDGVNYQLWAEATEQGRVAGANAAGDRISFTSVPLGASFEGMNTAMYAIGDVGKEDKEYKIIEYKNELEKSFRKYWFADGKLTGGVLFGNTEKVPVLNDAIEKGSSYYTIAEML